MNMSSNFFKINEWIKADEHNNASINLDTSELEGLENEGEIDQESLNLKLLDKSQSDDVSNIKLF